MPSFTNNIFSYPKTYTLSTSPNSAFSSGKDIGTDASSFEQKLMIPYNSTPLPAFELSKALGLTLNTSKYSNSFSYVQTDSRGNIFNNRVNPNPVGNDIGFIMNNYCW